MINIGFIIFYLGKVYLEKALDSYELDVGMAPSWMSVEQRKSAVVDRWYVDIKTAKCKPFQYLGSLGNFNNFVSKAVCENHLKFTQEEKANACDSLMSEGSCEVPDADKKERWYYSKSAVNGGSPNSCYSFQYTGCGGNANNFDSLTECKNACHNKINGKVTGNPNDDELTDIPNKFDCSFSAEVDTHDSKMRIILHKSKKKCVYAAVGKDANRGYFKDLPTCVDTCIDEKVAACNADGPFQVVPETTIKQNDAENLKEFFYFNKTGKVCLPFISQIPDQAIKVDDGGKNIFSSAEHCASFCPATKQIGELKAVEVCKQPKVGVASDNDGYKLPRFYYETTGQHAGKCQSFTFNGKEMNLNNFISNNICEAICKTPLASVVKIEPVVAQASTPTVGLNSAQPLSGSVGQTENTDRIDSGDNSQSTEGDKGSKNEETPAGVPNLAASSNVKTGAPPKKKRVVCTIFFLCGYICII